MSSFLGAGFLGFGSGMGSFISGSLNSGNFISGNLISGNFISHGFGSSLTPGVGVG